MNPIGKKTKKTLVVVIYSKNQSITGDIAALLSNFCELVFPPHREDLLESLNTKPDVLLLVQDDSNDDRLHPATVLENANKIGCRVILLGDWSPAWRSQVVGSVVSFPDMPRPGKLVQIVKGQAETG
jgi:hypothetical protein